MRVLLGLTAFFLLTAAAPAPPPAPPAVGVKAVSLAGGVRRIESVLPARLVATAYPRGADGKRRVIALLDTNELYLIDTAGSGSQRRLLADLPEKASTLLAADLDGDGADEILLGEPGTLWTLGTPEEPAAPRKVLDGVDARSLLGINDNGASGIAAAEVGRLRIWRREGGKLVPGTGFELPVRAKRQRTAIRLETPGVARLPQGTGAPSSQSPLYLVGPEANGKTRLLTLLLTRGADGAEQRTDSWSRFPGPEQVNEHWFVRIDGRPLLIVTTTNAEKVSIFEKKKLRVFPFAADRTRAGQVPVLSSPTETPRWFPIEPTVADLDRDGREDLVVARQEGLRGKSLLVEAFFGKGQGQGRFELPSRKTEIDLQARAWHYGADVTGDGRPDLVAIQQKKLSVFAGTDNPRRAPLDSRPRLTLDLPATEGIAINASAGDGGVDVNKEGADPLQVIDLDGDGRGEIVHVLRDDQGRGRVTVVRWGG